MRRESEISMEEDVVILIAEDEEGHALLIKKNLLRAGITNQITRFRDGARLLDFLYQRGEPPHRQQGCSYLLLLDRRMPRVDGVEVLRELKGQDEYKLLPIIVITTTDDPREIQECHRLGCNNYITKPVDYNKFVEAIRKLGLFLKVVQVPETGSESHE